MSLSDSALSHSTHRKPDMNEPNTMKAKAKRGFAAMDPQRQREIACLGGRAAHANGHAHEFTVEEARAAGRKRHARNAEQRAA
jgi:general stress protein YciG